jgi:hypothetical protein
MFAFAYAGLAQNDGLAISILFGAASFIVGLAGGVVWLAYGLRLRPVPESRMPKPMRNRHAAASDAGSCLTMASSEVRSGSANKTSKATTAAPLAANSANRSRTVVRGQGHWPILASEASSDIDDANRQLGVVFGGVEALKMIKRNQPARQPPSNLRAMQEARPAVVAK